MKANAQIRVNPGHATMQIPHQQLDNFAIESPPISDFMSDFPTTDFPARDFPIASDREPIAAEPSTVAPIDLSEHLTHRPRPQPKGFRQHPVIVLTGIWLVLMVLGWLSMAEIISPGANAPLPKTPIATAQREKNSSLSVLGAIAVSCAVMSVLLAQKMERRR
jgi:hypothetical protein